MVVTKQEFTKALNEINTAFQAIDKALAELTARLEAREPTTKKAPAKGMSAAEAKK